MTTEIHSAGEAFLLKHGWARMAGTRKFGEGGHKAPKYWRDPDPESLEPMLHQTMAIEEQRKRNKRR